MKTERKEVFRDEKATKISISKPKLSAFGTAMRKYSGTGKIVDMRAVMR
jgi:hypothetical protein